MVKKNNVLLKFNNNAPICMEFPDQKVCMSIGKLSDIPLSNNDLEGVHTDEYCRITESSMINQFLDLSPSDQNFAFNSVIGKVSSNATASNSSVVSGTDVQVGSQEALECMPKEFPQLRNKKKYIKNRFKVKNTKAVYIAPNSFIQLSCFIEGIPNDKANNCLIIFSNSPKLCFETLGGLLPKIIAPKTCKFEYVTKKQGVQLSQNQIIG